MSTDPQSAFGGIISFNREVDASLAEEIISSFKEGIIAPSYSKEALEIFSSKENLRIMGTGNLESYQRSPSLRSLDGGWLLQEADEVCISISDCKVVSKRKPTNEELEGLEFGWKVVKHV